MEDYVKKIVESSEEDFLMYLIDCCENVLENPKIVLPIQFHPITLQLMKLRAEVTLRLQDKFKINYGKFALGKHLFAKVKVG